jgi:5-(carboxyamino)imidazole ribonucleotide synthase
MLALAAAPLGIDCRFIDPSPDAGAGVAAEQICAAFDDLEALTELADWSDAVTFEFENVPAEALAAIDTRTVLAPNAHSLEVSQDRLLEKRLFSDLGLEVAEHHAVASDADLATAIDAIGGPAILKTRRLGYDGKGQMRISEPAEAAGAFAALGGVPAILERIVDFEREISAIVVRSADGEVVAYPPAENVHRAGILKTSLAPAPELPRELIDAAQRNALAVAERLGHVGVLAVEMFVTGDRLLINELAPRVHNSGHWTLDGAGTSQFENHVRAVAGLPLGAALPVAPTVMVNLVGGLPESNELLAVPGAMLHLYGKSARAGRKLGHVNVVELGSAGPPLAERAAQIATLADAAWR